MQLTLDIPTLITQRVTGPRESESGKLWPSSLGGCIRKEIFRLRGLSPTHPEGDETKWKLYRFGWYEQAVADALAGMENVVSQLRVADKYWSGKIDFMVGGTIIEVKSVSPAGIKKGDLPYQHHLWQVWGYCILAQKARDESSLQVGNSDAQIIYISRFKDDDLPIIRQFDVTPTETELAKTVVLMKEYEGWASKTDTLPPIPYGNPDEHPWECKRWDRGERVIACPYYGRCWSETGQKDGDVWIPW